MPKFPKPFYRHPRQRWYVEIGGRQINLGPDKDEAFRRYHDLMIDRGKSSTNKIAPVQSVVGLIDTFLEWCHKHKAKRTYEWYVEKTSSFARTLPHELTIDQLRPFHIQEWVDSHEDWSAGQKRGCMTAVQRVFNWAVKQGRIDRSPVRFLEKPEQGRRDTMISPELFAKILSKIKSAEFRDLLIVCWETGCRPQEAIRVEARHVDVTRARWVFPVEEAKGKRRVRTVYLTSLASEITQRRIAECPNGPIFLNRGAEPWTPHSVACCFSRLQILLGREELNRIGDQPRSTEIRRLADDLRRRGRDQRKGKRVSDKELLGIARGRLVNLAAARHAPKFCLYNLRHSWATRALESGIDGVTVSVLMGHADTRMLCRVYQHLSQNPENLREALDRVKDKK